MVMHLLFGSRNRKKTRLNPNHHAAALAGWLALAPAMLLAGDHADWQTKMRPITPKAISAAAPPAPIFVDGKLDEPAWAQAAVDH